MKKLVGKIAIVGMLALMVGGMFSAPAEAHDRHWRHHDNGHHYGWRNNDRGWDRHHHRGDWGRGWNNGPRHRYSNNWGGRGDRWDRWDRHDRWDRRSDNRWDRHDRRFYR